MAVHKWVWWYAVAVAIGEDVEDTDLCFVVVLVLHREVVVEFCELTVIRVSGQLRLNIVLVKLIVFDKRKELAHAIIVKIVVSAAVGIIDAEGIINLACRVQGLRTW